MRRGEIESKIETTSPLPTTAARVFDLLDDPDVDISELLEVVKYDPGLTSNVLRLANAASSAALREIVSIHDALVRLGTKQVSQMVLASVTAPLMRPAIKGYDLPPGKLLEHSVSVALAADELANVVKADVPEHVFTAGLLHDVGKIVLGTYVEVDATPILELAYEEEISFELAERRVLGIDHAEVGGRLLEHWQLPASIVDVVRWHHQPECSDEDDPLLVALVHIADNLSLEAGIGAGVDGLNYHPSREIAARLPLKTMALERVMCRMMTRLNEIRDVLTTGTERR